MNKNILILFVLLWFLSISAISQLTFGFYDNPPKIFKDELSDKATGFWADVTNEIGKDANIHVKWVFGTWADCIDRLKSGEIDVMIDVAEIGSRKESMLFSNEMVLLSWSTIYTHKKNKVSSLLDFQNATIGVLSRSVNYKNKGGVVDLFKSFDVNVDYVEYDSYAKLLDAVAEGHIYGGVASKDIGNMYNISGQINTTPFWFQPIHLKYALSTKNPNAQEIISLLDKHISGYKKDNNSIYYQAISKHIDKQVQTYLPNWVKIVLVTLLILIIVFYLFNRILSAKVKAQTKYLTQEIAEREKAQHILEITKNKLEGLNKIKDNFLRSVSHELLTPLNAILGFSDVLLTKNEEITSELRNEYVKMINNSGNKLLKIVNNMLDATLINSKLMSVYNEEFIISERIEKLFNTYPKSDKLNYSLQIPDNADNTRTMITDFDKLRKILIHLLDNATQFTDKGEIVLGYSYNEEDITFFVKDTGIGISEINIDLIFQDFTKIESNKDRLSEGSGLGLAIVYALVTSLQGKIWAASAISKGSTFYVKLPLKINSLTVNEKQE